MCAACPTSTTWASLTPNGQIVYVYVHLHVAARTLPAAVGPIHYPLHMAAKSVKKTFLLARPLSGQCSDRGTGNHRSHTTSQGQSCREWLASQDFSILPDAKTCIFSWCRIVKRTLLAPTRLCLCAIDIHKIWSLMDSRGTEMWKALPAVFLVPAAT